MRFVTLPARQLKRSNALSFAHLFFVPFFFRFPFKAISLSLIYPIFKYHPSCPLAKAANTILLFGQPSPQLMWCEEFLNNA